MKNRSVSNGISSRFRLPMSFGQEFGASDEERRQDRQPVEVSLSQVIMDGHLLPIKGQALLQRSARNLRARAGGEEPSAPWFSLSLAAFSSSVSVRLKNWRRRGHEEETACQRH